MSDRTIPLSEARGVSSLTCTAGSFTGTEADITAPFSADVKNACIQLRKWRK
jgi:hypothetical protein